MAKQITTEIEIAASPERVWERLTDFNTYGSWNPFITSIEGEVKVGQRIKVRLNPPGKRAMTFQPKVLAFEKNKELRWLGHFLFPGIFDGEHTFELRDNMNGSTTLIHSEKFGGILVPFLVKMLDENTKQGFILMNQKLKQYCEMH